MSIKVIVVGNGQVGKTSMITRFAKGIFTNEYKKTIGVDFLEKTVHLSTKGEDCTFLLWDTAGQEEYDAITRTYYKGAGACVLAFSTVDRDSFDAIETWHAKVREECGDICTVLVQNKIDMIEEAKMTKEEVEGKARKLNLKLYRTCVKDDLNVSEVFTHLGTEFMNRGGAAGLGVTGIRPIEEIASTPLVDAGKPCAGASTPGADPAAGGEKAFKLGAQKPSKVRTGGKKSMFSGCSVL